MGAQSSVILNIYKALVRSLIDYANPVLLNVTNTDAKAVETIQSNALRAVFGALRWIKTANLRTGAHIS